MQLKYGLEKARNHKKEHTQLGTGRAWTPGAKPGTAMMQHPFSDHVAIDLSQLDHDGRYRFMTGTVVPRPIALVTSIGVAGILNAAPFSQFVIITYDPPMLGFVVHRGPNGLKDTLKNVLETGEFVINSVSEEMAVQVQRCSEPFPPTVSEVEKVGFHTIPSLTVRPCRIAESLVQYECRLKSNVEFGDPTATLIVGEVSMAHIVERVVDGRRINHAALNPLGRIAGRSYCKTRELVHV